MTNQNNSKPYLQLIRGKNIEELLRNPDVFLLLTQVALRAKRTGELNIQNLKIGESLIGDYKNIGLTEQRYRTAKSNAQKWGLATFQATNKGTIAKLLNTSIYNINQDDINEPANEQITNQATSQQRTSNEQITTKKNERNKEVKNKKEIEESQFEEFWNLYDYKKGKPKALIAYKSSLKKTTHELIIEGVKKYIADKKGTEKRFWLHPTTWLNAESWGDEYSTTQTVASSKKPDIKQKIKEATKPLDYNDVMKVIKEFVNCGDYKYSEDRKFFYVVENEDQKQECLKHKEALQIKLFHLKNDQSLFIPLTRGQLD